MNPNAHRISIDLYEFECWRGQKFEAVRGHKDPSDDAIVAERTRRGLAKRWEDADYPTHGYRWFVYSGDLCYGSYLSPHRAADIFQREKVTVNL